MRELNPAECDAVAGGLLMLTGWVPQPEILTQAEGGAPRIAPSPWSWSDVRPVIDGSMIPSLQTSNLWII